MGSLYIALIVVLSYLLDKASDMTAVSLKRVRARLRVNEFFASFFLLGVATSVPELAVALFSALGGVPELSLGNILGANIVVLSLMLGITIALSGHLSLKGVMRHEDLVLTLVLTGLPILVVLNGVVSRDEGVLLLAAFAIFCLYFYRNRRAYYQAPNKQAHIPKPPLIPASGRFLLAIILLLGISYLIVQVSLAVAAIFGIPLLVVGLLMIAIGTNVPEVSFVLSQGSRKHHDRQLVSGLLLGNVAINTPALGLLAVLHPFSITDVTDAWVSSGFLLLVLLTVGFLFSTGKTLTRKEGFLLVGIYAAFLTYQLYQYGGCFSCLVPDVAL